MKYKGTTFICGAVLTLLLGIGLETQTVKADDTNVAVTTEQVDTNSTDNQLVVQKNDTIDSNKYDPKYPGGDWNITLDQATPKNNFYVSVNKDSLAEDQQAHQQQQELADQLSSGDVSVTLETSDDASDSDISDETTDDVSPINDPDGFLISRLDKIADGTESADSINIQQAADYYQKVLDTLNSDDPDITSYQKDIEEISQIKDYNEFGQYIQKIIASGYSLPVSISWGNSPLNKNDSLINFNQTSDTSIVNIPGLGLDDDSILVRSQYYATTYKYLELLGFKDEQINSMLTNAILFNNLLKQVQIDQTTPEFTFGHDENPTILSLDQFYRQTGNLDLKTYIQSTFPDATSIQIFNPKLLASMSSIFNSNNFEMMKDWVVVSEVISNFYLLGSQGLEPMVMIQHIPESVLPTAKKQLAESLTGNYFAEPISRYYGEHVVDDEDIAYVTSIVNNIISTYESRIQNNDWLSDEGKQATINKLKQIKIFVGYPKTISEAADFSNVDLNSDGSLYDMEKAMSQYSDQKQNSHFGQSLPATFFVSSTLANAMYNPETNTIVAAAAFMTDPMYSKENTDSQNYGGIGVVIGHEISHAFDNDGSKYDGMGNVQEIWSEQDRQEFTKITNEVLKQYDGIPLFGHKVDGEFTLGENIADNGGIHAAYQAAQNLPEFNPVEFFETYEKGITDSIVPESVVGEFTDTHTPYPIRGNVNVQNDDDFYTAFDVQPGDPMYLDPAKRITIW